MAIIYSYPIAAPKTQDLIIGTSIFDENDASSDVNNPTVSFTVQSIINMISNSTGAQNLQQVTTQGNTTTNAVVINNNLTIAGKLFDFNNQPGSNGQVLYSTGTGIQWLAPTAYILPLATDGTRGGVQIGYTQTGTRDYPVTLSGEKMLVTVPWTDTQLPVATTTVLGGIELGSDTVLTTNFVTGNVGSTTRSYPVQLNAQRQAAVYVPWDENTEGVTVVTGVLPITSTGGDTPEIDINTFTTGASDPGLKGAVPAPTLADVGKYLKGDATWATLPIDPDTGITVVNLGVGTSTGVPLTESITSRELTLTSMAYAGTTKVGYVPAGGGATTYLRGDGSWVVPPTQGGSGYSWEVNAQTGTAVSVTTGTIVDFVGAVGITASRAATTGVNTITLTGTSYVSSVAALTLTSIAALNLSSTVADATGNAVITLNVPDATTANRGALTAANWNTFNNKVTSVTATGSGNGTGGIIVDNTDPKNPTVGVNYTTGGGDIVTDAFAQSGPYYTGGSWSSVYKADPDNQVLVYNKDLNVRRVEAVDLRDLPFAPYTASGTVTGVVGLAVANTTPASNGAGQGGGITVSSSATIPTVSVKYDLPNVRATDTIWNVIEAAPPIIRTIHPDCEILVLERNFASALGTVQRHKISDLPFVDTTYSLASGATTTITLTGSDAVATTVQLTGTGTTTITGASNVITINSQDEFVGTVTNTPDPTGPPITTVTAGRVPKFDAVTTNIVDSLMSDTGTGIALTGTSGNYGFTVTDGSGFKHTVSTSGETGFLAVTTNPSVIIPLFKGMKSALTVFTVLSGGTLEVTGDIVAYGSPSDKRFKENIKPIKNSLEKVLSLKGVTFDWKEKKDHLGVKQTWKEDIGFIAQEVQEVIPELVRENEDGYLSMRHQGIAPMLVEAIKELKQEIEELKLNKCNCKCK